MWRFAVICLTALCLSHLIAAAQAPGRHDSSENGEDRENPHHGTSRNKRNVQGCGWNVKRGLPDNQPLYLDPTATARDLLGFHLPAPSGQVTLPRGRLVTFACPGGHLISPFPAATPQVTLECDQGYVYKTPGGTRRYNFRDIQCSTLPKSEVKSSPRTCATAPGVSGSRITHHTVGFSVLINNNSDFYSVYDFCFDHTTNDAVYSHFKLTKSVEGRQIFDKNLNFKKGNGFYPRNVVLDNLYSKNAQTETISRILGNRSLALEVIVPSSPFYLVKGHLAAKAYFPYGSQQAATYWYMNAVPQFNSANNYNWKVLEDQIRDHVATRSGVYEVYVGSSGVLSRVGAAGGQRQPLHVYFNSADTAAQRRVKVPRVVWTVLYEPAARKGAAFLLLNTGSEPLSSLAPLRCSEVCGQLPWLRWPERGVAAHGLATCCALDRGLLNSVPEIPRGLDVTSGLPL